MEEKLTKARQTIGEIDLQMAQLFEKRMQCVKDVAEHKMQRGLPVFDAAREEYLIKKNSELIKNPEIRNYYIPYLQNAMDISKRYQHKILEGMNIAYSGVEGAYAHIAAGRIFPDGNRISYPDFKSAYEAVENGECECAVIPIENSFAGEVGQVIDLMFSGSLCVNAVYSLAIRHNLIGVNGAKIEDIKQVISHQQALDQCSSFIRNQGYKVTSIENTAMAAQQVAFSNDKSIAAIASKETADIYSLSILKENVNESDLNTTKFAVLSRVMNEAKMEQSMLVFTAPHEAGSLANAINIIAKHGFNMKSIKSRSLKSLLWTYYFYVEIDGDLTSEKGEMMMAELTKNCDKLKIIGTYNSNCNI